MHSTTALIAFSAVLTASALPQNTPVGDNDMFGIITIRSGSAIQNSGVQAARRSLFVNLPQQNATCDTPSNFATFYIQNSELHLYATSATPQTIFVDRSGMGRGKIGYTTGAESLGRNWETKGWALNNNELEFDGTGIQACPNSIDGAWSLWLSGVQNPGFNVNCTGIIAAAYATDSPISCLYTE